MQLAVQLVTILFMLTFMLIGIWGLVLMIKTYNQVKYKNYILEKLSQNVYMITAKFHKEDGSLTISDEDINLFEDSVSNISQFKK